jgi:putative tricarboxylic transport membrane protein
MLFCLTGMYSVNNFIVDLWVMLGCGALGYLMRRWAYEGAPLLLALVLGPRLEVAFRQSLMISHGDFGIFVGRPVSLVFLLATAGFLLVPLIKRAMGSGSAARKHGSPA